MFPTPSKLRTMIERAATDQGLSFSSPGEKRDFVNLRATAAEQQYWTAMSEIPEEQIHLRIQMEKTAPLGAMQWRNQYESQIAEAALSQALEFYQVEPPELQDE